MKKGFTLIELLVVIAIIGILAAITFPVFARAKTSAFKSADMSNLNAIRTALQLYRADQGGYPPALLGYTTLYNDSSATIVPANQLIGALYPKRIDSLETLRPALNRSQNAGNFNTMVTTAVWPNKAGNQKFGPSDGPVLGTFVNGGGACTAKPNYYYEISGYEVAQVPDGAGGKRQEIHYAPFWSKFTVPTDPCKPLSSEQGDVNDDPRQLGYAEPPETTVITWDSFFRDYTNGIPNRTKNDVVLFLGGSARPYDSAQVSAMSWQVTP